MANLRDIKRRISSVSNTQKITKAMKLVAAAKFARASQAVNASRPYSKAFGKMIQRLVAASDGQMEAPLLEVKEEKRILVVTLATDKGLCGGLNSNVLKSARRFLDTKVSQGTSCDLYTWGRKASSWGKKQPEPVIGEKEKLLDKPTYARAQGLCAELIETFHKESYDAVYFSFMEFQSALTQEPKVEKLLPVSVEDSADAAEASGDFILEPGLAEMLDTLLERRLCSQIFQALLEHSASEHGSRMTAMDSATTNASEVQKKLKLQYNRARQAAITKELIEIISGAEAL